MKTRSRHIRNRLLRNKGALFSLIVIGLSILTAVFAYFLAPDDSPDANRIIVEIGSRGPGFRQLFLPLKKKRQPAPVGFFGRLLYGREDQYEYIPINSYAVQKDSLIVQKFVDEGVEERRAYPLPAGTPAKLTFWLGTDKYGRDILSRLLIGVRVSLAVGLVTVLLSLSVGVLLGALAGYFRGRVDEGILWLVNVDLEHPHLVAGLCYYAVG